MHTTVTNLLSCGHNYNIVHTIKSLLHVDGTGNTIQDNSSIFSLIQMHYLSSTRKYAQ